MVYWIVKQSGGTSGPIASLSWEPRSRSTYPRSPEPLRLLGRGPGPAGDVEGATVLVCRGRCPSPHCCRRALTDVDFEVLDAGDGLQALEFLSQQRPVDVVLTDLAMPELGGRELAQQLSRMRSGLP